MNGFGVKHSNSEMGFRLCIFINMNPHIFSLNLIYKNEQKIFRPKIPNSPLFLNKYWNNYWILPPIISKCSTYFFDLVNKVLSKLKLSQDLNSTLPLINYSLHVRSVVSLNLKNAFNSWLFLHNMQTEVYKNLSHDLKYLLRYISLMLI